MIDTLKIIPNVPMNFSGKLTTKIIIKDDYVRTDGTSALYIQIFLNKKRRRIPLHLSVKPVEFDKKKQRIKPKSIYAADYNLVIEKVLANINKIEVNYRLTNIPLSIDLLMQEFMKPTSRIDFLKFWEEEMERQKMILKFSTYRQQMSILNKVKSFKSTILFYEITNDFIEDMKAYFKNKQKNTPNTISTLIKSFKKYLHLANKRGIVTSLHYSDLHNKAFRSNRTFLNKEELHKLNAYYKQEWINPTHKAILSRFLFACFTGLRISDIQNLKSENLLENYIIFTAIKPGKLQRIQLNKSALSFINPEIIFEGSFSDQHINRELKEICKLLNINKKVSFHVARHTFATNFLLSGGRVEYLQKLLGHSKITETMLYVHIVESITDQQIHNMDDILYS